MTDTHRMHIILSAKHKGLLNDLCEDLGLSASDVVRMLISKAHKDMRRANK